MWSCNSIYQSLWLNLWYVTISPPPPPPLYQSSGLKPTSTRRRLDSFAPSSIGDVAEEIHFKTSRFGLITRCWERIKSVRFPEYFDPLGEYIPRLTLFSHDGVNWPSPCIWMADGSENKKENWTLQRPQSISNTYVMGYRNGKPWYYTLFFLLPKLCF